MTQEAIDTISRLTRLFHAPQTRRSGGLRSQNASCTTIVDGINLWN